jgi:drug/metabolite transporter (DMT)-like permease
MIVAMTPIIVMLLAAAILREGISFGKLIGVGFGVAGALLVILQAQTHGVGRDDLQGIFYAVLNTISFGLYMIITRKVTQKYSAMTLLLWTYFFGVIMFVPFTFTTLPEQVLFQGNTPWHIWGALVFVLVFATTLAYFLLPLALRYIHTTTVSLYMNLQPIVASVVAILLGQDILTWDKPVAVLLVITGVYIVTRAERRG